MLGRKVRFPETIAEMARGCKEKAEELDLTFDADRLNDEDDEDDEDDKSDLDLGFTEV